MDKYTSLSDLHADVCTAKRLFEAAIAERFTKGLSVRVRWGTRSTPAEVLRVNWDRVEVLSIHGAVYQVEVHRLVEFEEL